MKIGIFGYGRFGKLTADVIKERTDAKVYVHSGSNTVDNKTFFEFEEVAQCDVIIPTVPISAMEDFLRKISEVIKKDALLIDVCSVKIFPVQKELEILPKSIDIWATHPMFGPVSTKNGISFEGLKFIHKVVRLNNKANNLRIKRILKFLADLKLNIIELSPEEHDRQAAYSHAYAFLVGKIGSEMGLKDQEVTTKGFEFLLTNQRTVENDSNQLFLDMLEYNPYVKKMIDDFEKSFKKIKAEIS